MAPWRQVWREGFVPLLNRKGLEALAQALREHSPSLISGLTTEPPPLRGHLDSRVIAACAIAYCGWRGEGLQTVGAVVDYVHRTCCEVDQRLGRKRACVDFLNWFDDTPWDTVRRELLAEVELALRERRNEEV